MKILSIDTYDCVALLKYEDYIKVEDYLKNKGDFLPEGCDITVSELPFEDFIEELFREYEGCGYNDALIGVYEYINKYAYQLIISREEEEEEYNDFTPNRMIEVTSLIMNEIKDDNCESSLLIMSFLNQIIKELTMSLEFELIETDVIDSIYCNSKKSKYYRAPLTLSQYELFRMFFKVKVNDCVKDGLFNWTNIEAGPTGVILRDENYNFTEVWIEKENQTYFIYMTGYDSYQKGKYSDKKFNEYSLPDKNVLIKLFDTLKYSDYCVPEHYDFIPNLIIDSINALN